MWVGVHELCQPHPKMHFSKDPLKQGNRNKRMTLRWSNWSISTHTTELECYKNHWDCDDK